MTLSPADSAEDLLAADPDFQTVCDARRDAWIAAMEAHAEPDTPALPWHLSWTPAEAQSAAEVAA